MQRVIMHSDINHCYAQIHEMMHPKLKDVPMLIGGSEEKRNGIVLARNLLAKSYGIKTAQTLWEARELCPNVLVISPDYNAYQYYSEKVKDIYREYSDQVESFGIDEAWVDLSHSTKLFGDPIEIAKEIQKRVLDEIGLTISIGLSFNKIFAKLGSDLIKPSGFVVISEENYKEKVFPLSVDQLLNVGRATTEKLNKIKIYTIGDLAKAPLSRISDLLGKNGEMIWSFANGLDYSTVNNQAFVRDPKSIGNGITSPKDINDTRELKMVFQVLVESVASRLKDIDMVASVISINIRSSSLKSFSKQTSLEAPTNTSSVIMKWVMDLANDDRTFMEPIRSIRVKASKLSKDNHATQLNLFYDANFLHKEKQVDKIIDDIRNKFSFDIIKRANVLEDESLTNFNPKGAHTIFPVGFF